MLYKVTQIYATKNDLLELVKSVLDKKQLQFTLAGMFDNNPSTASDDFPYSDDSASASVLVFNKGKNINFRNVETGTGKQVAIDQLTNEGTVMIHQGGKVKECQVKYSRLLSGQVGVNSEDIIAMEIYNVFVKDLRNSFNKIKSYYVGPEATKLLDSGGHLSPTANSPRDYDLAR